MFCFDTAFLSGKFNLLPEDKILDWSKFKVFAEDSFKIAQMVPTFYVENIEGKGENAGYKGCFKNNVSVFVLQTHSHTRRPFDAPGKQAF